MAVPSFQRFMLPLLKRAQLGETRIVDIKDDIASELGLSDTDLEQLVPSGRKTTFYDRLNWAKTYLKHAGLVRSTRRSYFKITEEGRRLLASGVKEIDISLLKTIPAFNEKRERQIGEYEGGQPANLISDETEIRTPEDVLRQAIAEINSDLGTEIIDRLRNAPPAFFERVVVQLLLSMGYGGTLAQAGKAIGRTGDNGIDGVIDQDTLGLDRVYVQAKRYAESTTVGAGDIRDFFGSLDMHKATKGLFVTTSIFTKAASETAEKLGKRIVLIDGRDLSKLMIRFNVGCRVEEIYEIKKIDESEAAHAIHQPILQRHAP